MHNPIFHDLLILLLFSVIVVLILNRFKLPSILGFLLTGLIIGPHGFSLVKASEEIDIIAEIGVILLLFVIGMELSIRQLLNMRRMVFIGGSIQVLLVVTVTTGVAYFLDFTITEAVFIGFLFSLSSTAIVLKILNDRNELSSPHGRNALGILIFQDIIVVPMILVTPILAGESGELGPSIVSLVIKFSLVIVLTFVGARYIIPALFYQVAKTKSKELFIITTIAVCFLVAYLTSIAGLSLALGAFLAGLIISESAYSHQATSIILPFREVFTSFFFISIGMLLNLSFLIENWFMVLILVVSLFIFKTMLVGSAAALLKFPKTTILLTGLSLFQVGEFAFILSKTGIEYGLISDEMNQYFLSASIISMILTPFVFMSFGTIKKRLIRTLDDKIAPQELSTFSDESTHYNDHLVIIGYGLNGQNVARAAREADIPYVIIEFNPDTVKQEKANGEPIIYGDAAEDHILHEVAIGAARSVVIAISNKESTEEITKKVRENNQSAFLIVRTRYIKEIDHLLDLGADEVIPEEFETSIEIFSLVLHNYMVPVNEIEHLVYDIRSDRYQLFRNSDRRQPKIRAIPDLQIRCVYVYADSGDIVGKPLKESDIRNKFGINILAIERDKEVISNVTPDMKIERDDKLFVSGDSEHIHHFSNELSI